MEDLLTPVSRTYRKAEEEPELLTLSQSTTKPTNVDRSNFSGASPEEALDALRSQPDYEAVISVLGYLQRGVKGKHPFNILRPSPQGAQIVHILVTDISPNYWSILKDEPQRGTKTSSLDLLLGCLRSITGINAALVFLRALLQEAKKDTRGPKNSPLLPNIRFTLELLSEILRSDGHLQKVWHGTSAAETNLGKTRALRQEFVSLLAGGKIISTAAEAEVLLREAEMLESPLWLADGKDYVEWLARSLVHWVEFQREDVDVKICSELLARSLKLGRPDSLVKMLYTSLLLRDETQAVFAQLLDNLPQIDQRKVVTIILKILSSQLPLDSDRSTEDYPLIWAAAGVLKSVVGSSQLRKDHLVAWLTEATGAGIGDSCGIRRAAVAVVGGDKETITMVLEKSLNQFGDQLYIKHSPLLQQEAHAQVLLLSAGYVHRISPIKLNILLRSGPYLTAISNRIAAFQDRAKFLGMAVGEALSGLVHGAEKKLDFHMDEMNSEEAQWYKSLVQISDQIGPISPLKVQDAAESKTPKTSKPSRSSQKPVPRPPKQTPSSGFIIEEIEDDEEEDEDDDLVPYDKPDSDAEDSDDDPTLINRDKPKAPVYIRDLITYLRDVDNYDRQKLALQTAPVLIRRKANYGTEVSSHAEELAALLVGLSDKYDLDNFHSLRLQGMVAVIVALPQRMGPWFSKTFFDGDYSLSQRASILVILGLAGRELAGYETSEYTAESAFPSKQLPAKLERHYASLPASSSNSVYESSRTAANLRPLPPNALDNISQSLSQTFLAPLAAEAADAATGPDALKLSTFTSRLEQQKQQSQEPNLVEQKSTLSTSRSKARGVRAIPNTTANLLSTSFFFPLTARFQAAVRATAGGSSNILFQPHLLSLYVRTLALLLHAAGPSTLALPRMTTEFWDLLLGVLRSSSSALAGSAAASSSSSSLGRAAAELPVLHAVLFGLLALLDVHEAGAGDGLRGLCERHGREVVETTEWVSAVFDRVRGGDAGGDGEENQVKMMAAGVLIRLRDAVERYRGLLMGDLIGYA